MPDVQAQDQTTESTAQAESTSQVDPADAALDAAFAKDGLQLVEDEQGRSVEKPLTRGPDGKFVSTKVKDEQPAAEDAKAPSKYSDDDVRKATAAALRVAGKDGLPKALAAAIESGDEGTIAHYLKLSKIQADGDDFTNKHKTLQQELEALKKAANSGDKAKADATASTAYLDDAAKPLASYLTETLGDENAPEHVRASLAALEKSIIERAKVEQSQQLAAMQSQLNEMALERARAELMSEYPDLKDKAVWENVRKQFDDLPESESRPDMLTRLEHAARIELAPEMSRRSKDERDRKNKLRDQGSPTPVSRSGEAKSNLSPSDIADQYLEALEKGDQGKVAELKSVMHSRFNPK